MAYFLFKCWHEQLFFAERERAVPRVTDLPVTLVPITEENAALVRDLRGARFEEQFRYQLSLGDFGYYACLDGKPIGYGWAKHAGSDDYFFKIGAGCVYLCRFFVHETARGHGVYPLSDIFPDRARGRHPPLLYRRRARQRRLGTRSLQGGLHPRGGIRLPSGL